MRKMSLWNNQNDWGLFNDFDRLQTSMNQLFGDFGRQYRADTASEFSGASYLPACDVEETSGHYVMSFDLPGVKKEDIQIEVENNQLVISGERKSEKESSGVSGQRYERTFGRFQRAFSLPVSVDNEKIEANFENGVLTLILPKQEAAKARQVKIAEGKSNLLDRVFGKKPELKSAGEAN